MEPAPKQALQKIVSAVFIAFSIFQVVVVIIAYFEQKASITNPLIPEQLLVGIRNFTIFIVLVYLLVIAANLFCILKRRACYAVQVMSFLALLAFQFFYPEIIDFFLNSNS